MNPKNTLKRREFIQKSTLVAAGLVSSTILVGSCTNQESPAPGSGNQTGSFQHGVASFDPTNSKVILWTRVNPVGSVSKITLNYTIATDNAFRNVIKTDSVDAGADDDFTVSIDIGGLTSNTRYYYQFTIAGTGTASPIGETKTLPTGTELSEVKLAVCSCSNYPAGLFNVYGAMAVSEADVILHLGDYIYEYGDKQYGTNGSTVSLNRVHSPPKEIIELADYRTRYKQYRSDAQLQAAHQKKPFICVWDDHELANDAYKDGAQNHNPGEGDFTTRKQAAIKAYHEYIGIRTDVEQRIYRSFSFGTVLDLHMLDTRLIARDKQLSYSTYVNSAGQLDVAAFQKDVSDPKRTLLGSEQLSWLGNALATGKGSWQVLGQQVLMTKMLVPAELVLVTNQLLDDVANNGSVSPAALLTFQTLLTQLTQIKVKTLVNDPTLTPQEMARVNNVLPYNLDAWDGYAAEREAVYALAKGKKLIALAGDTHNGWFGDLTTSTGSVVGREVATPSVTSPGFDAYLTGTAATISSFEIALSLLINDLTYADATRRGYALVKFSASQAVAEWRYVGNVTTLSTTTVTGHTETITS